MNSKDGDDGEGQGVLFLSKLWKNKKNWRSKVQGLGFCRIEFLELPHGRPAGPILGTSIRF
jgi:hypothetical protein